MPMNRIVTLVLASLIALSASACTHSLTVLSEPDGAEARLIEDIGDKNIYLGKTPTTRSVKGIGEYTLVVWKENYVTANKRIRINDGGTYRFVLKPIYHFTVRSMPAGAEISIINERTGERWDLGPSPVSLTVEGDGPYSYIAQGEGLPLREGVIEVEPGVKETPLLIELK